MRALIVGGGVAGPATAIALAKAGVGSVILERRPAAERGGGSYLTVAPNGLSALDALGLLDLVTEIGVPSRTNVMYGADARLLGRVGLGPPVRDDLVALTLKRSDLAAALTAEALRRGIEVRHGAEVAGVAESAAGVQVTLDDGTTVAGDLLVGADGVHSSVRRSMDPGAPAARYVGLTNFGGITENSAMAADLEPAAWHFVFGRRAFFGAHPTPDGRVVWFVNVPEPEISRERRARTPSEVWQQQLVTLMSDDAGPAAQLIRAGRLELAADNTYDLPHVPTWSRGRTVLVGDAVHAPSPSSGQGASMALEDAVVLGQALRDTDDLPAAFAAYEKARRRRVERIVKAGARSSSTKTPGPIGRRFTEAAMRIVFRYVVTDRSTAWMNGHRLDWDAPVVAA